MKPGISFFALIMVGNTSKGSHEFRFENLKMQYTEYDFHGEVISTFQKNVEKEKTDCFTDQLKRLRADKWNSEYQNESADESSLYFRITMYSQDFNVDSFGYNAFPPNGTNYVNKHFRSFMDSVKKASGMENLILL